MSPLPYLVQWRFFEGSPSPIQLPVESFISLTVVFTKFSIFQLRVQRFDFDDDPLYGALYPRVGDINLDGYP